MSYYSNKEEDMRKEENCNCNTRDEKQQAGILNCMEVQVTIVLARTQAPICLGYKEKGKGLGWFQGYDFLKF